MAINKLHTILLILFTPLSYLFSQNIPSSRITDWTNPGSQPIFQAEQIVSLDLFGADTSGVMASDDALQQAIIALDGPGEIFVPKGTYLFEAPMDLPDSIIIRGEMDSLSLSPLAKFRLSPGNNQHGIRIIGSEINIDYHVTYPLIQGDQKIFVTQVQLFSEGDFIKIVPFDDSLLVNDTWAYHSTGQIFQVVQIDGDSLVLNKPLRRSYDGNHFPDIYKLSPRRQVHLKCITIEIVDTSASQTSTIYINSAVDCSLSGIESNFCNYAHVDIVNSSRITVTNSYFKDAHDYGSGGKGYGVMLEFTSGDCLISQNIFHHLRHSMILQAGANGNVLAYNYSIDPFWSGTALPSNSSGDLVLHGNYLYMNLLESNVVQNIVIDNSHGINGPFNTFFRNRAELYGIFMNTGPASNSQNFIGNQVTNTSSIFLGFYNLQGNDHFEFGNMIKGTVMPTGTDEPEDVSLFGYPFNAFYTTLSSIPPIKNNNWQSMAPLIEAHYRYQVVGKKAVCEDVNYLPTSIEETSESQENLFVVYPNPFTDEFMIQNNTDKKEIFIRMYNTLGQLVHKEKLFGERNTINACQLNPGMYFINIEGLEKTMLKILK